VIIPITTVEPGRSSRQPKPTSDAAIVAGANTPPHKGYFDENKTLRIGISLIFLKKSFIVIMLIFVCKTGFMKVLFTKLLVKYIWKTVCLKGSSGHIGTALKWDDWIGFNKT
jgi:hypothetical protein